MELRGIASAKILIFMQTLQISHNCFLAMRLIAALSDGENTTNV